MSLPGLSSIIRASILCVSAFLASLSLTAVTRTVCRRWEFVARPRDDRWHSKPTSLFGGVPIWLSFTLIVSLELVLEGIDGYWKVIAASSLMFLLGFLDDIRHLRPRTKLAGQVAICLLFLASGALSPLPQPTPIFAVLGLLWIVGLTNAFNLVDNMDGLAAGIALLCAIFVGAVRLVNGDALGFEILLIFSGALGGFLCFNVKPATIFMGDAGSLFIGFFLAASCLFQLKTPARVGHRMLAAVLIMATPLFDVVFVSITRHLRGQSIAQGGTDHTSHRLVRRGLSDQQAVILLYSLTGISALIGFVANFLKLDPALGITSLTILFLAVFGIELFNSEFQAQRTQRRPSVFLHSALRRSVISLWMEPAILLISFYLSFLGIQSSSLYPWTSGFLIAALLVGSKLLFLWMCARKRDWWRTDLKDSIRIALALFVGELLAAIALFTAVGGVVHFYSLFVDVILSISLVLAFRRSPFIFRTVIATYRTHESIADTREIGLAHVSGFAVPVALDKSPSTVRAPRAEVGTR